MKDLINTIPFLRSSIPDPVRYFDTEYRRFTQMSKMGLFELVPTWSSEQGNTVCSVTLVEQDQPTIVETGRAGAWLFDREASEAAAHFHLIAELKKTSRWERMRKALGPRRDVAGNSIGKESEKPNEKTMLQDSHSSHNEKNAMTNSMTEIEHHAETPPNAIQTSPANRAAIEFTADDELLDMMKFYRDDLLQLSKNMGIQLINLGLRDLPYTPRVDFSGVPLDRGDQRSKELKEALEMLRRSKNPKMLDIRSKVDSLPIMNYKQKVLDLVNNNPFSIIVAETGSGKSTQVPQMILDDAIDRDSGGKCNILCTQPRRLAAHRLAYRVAEERSENVGRTVGYMVRHNRRVSTKDTHITFCTTGILLNILQSSLENLESFSHIIIDEVHVRDIGIDFVMLLLKRYIRTHVGKRSKVPRVIVMSATMDTKTFASYLSLKGRDGKSIPAPHITVPGRQFHVNHHYLDDILESIESSPHADTLKGLVEDVESNKFLDKHYAFFGDPTTEELEAPVNSLPVEEPLIPAGLYAATIFNILSSTETGSILCFLPGLRSIMAVQSYLMTHGTHMGLDMFDNDRFRVGILHSRLPEEQEKLEASMPVGCRRIILSTDIAEASVTLPDVKYVVDSGKVNTLLVNQKTYSRRLADCWATKTNTKQRAGRVGRVHNGDYYFIGTKRRFDTLQISQTPAILQGDLQDTCLRAKVFAGKKESIWSFLKDTLEPPNQDDVDANVDALKQLQALNEKEKITPLGGILSQLSLSSQFGKLLILGVIFRCLDPLITLACLGSKSFFLRTTDPVMKKLVRGSTVEFAEGTASDHLARLNAYKAVRQVHIEKGYFAAREYAFSNHIWFREYEIVRREISQVFDQMKYANIIEHWHPLFDKGVGGENFNVNSDHTPLIKALLLHCLFPRLAGSKSISRTFVTNFEDRAMIHPSSVVNLGREYTRSLVVYSEKVETTSPIPFLMDNTLVSPLMASLFGGRLIWDTKELSMDSWLDLTINPDRTLSQPDEVARNLIEMQKALNVALTQALHSIADGYQVRQIPSKLRAFQQSQNELHEALSDAVKGLLDRDRDPSDVRSLQLSKQKKWEKPWEMDSSDSSDSLEVIVDQFEDGVNSADSIVV